MMCYKADGYPIGAPWRSPLFMYKWASRKKMEIVSVTPVRLQDGMIEKETIKEGFATLLDFILGWDSINPAYNWAMSPWVWRIEWVR